MAAGGSQGRSVDRGTGCDMFGGIQSPGASERAAWERGVGGRKRRHEMALSHRKTPTVRQPTGELMCLKDHAVRGRGPGYAGDKE